MAQDWQSRFVPEGQAQKKPGGWQERFRPEDRNITGTQAFLMNVAESGTGGLIYPAQAAVRSLEQGIPYKEALPQVLEAYQEAEKQHPKLSTMGDIVGYATPTGLAGLAAKGLKKAGTKYLGEAAMKKFLPKAVAGGLTMAGTEAVKTKAKQEELAAGDILLNMAAGVGGEAVGGAVVKGIETAGPWVGKKLISALRGISSETIDTYLKNPKGVKAAIKMNLEREYVPQFIQDTTQKVRSFVTSRLGQIDDILMANDKKLIDATPILETAQQTMEKLGKRLDEPGKAAVARMKKIIADVKPTYVEKAADTAFAMGAPVKSTVKAQPMMLTPSQLNQVKKGLQDELKAYYKKTGLDKDAVGSALNTIETKARTMLEAIDPRIKTLNKELGDAAEWSRQLGFKDAFEEMGVLDPNRAQNMLSTLANANKMTQYEAAKKMDKLVGTKMHQASSIFRAAKDLFGADLLSSIKTGRSVLGPLIGLGAGSMLGPAGIAAGTLGMAALQSPVLTLPLISAGSAMGGAATRGLAATLPRGTAMTIKKQVNP